MALALMDDKNKSLPPECKRPGCLDGYGVSSEDEQVDRISVGVQEISFDPVVPALQTVDVLDERVAKQNRADGFDVNHCGDSSG